MEHTGQRIRFYIVQTRADETDYTQFMTYDTYRGTFNTTSSIDSATHWEEDQEDLVTDIVNLLNSKNQLMDGELTYDVIKETLTRVIMKEKTDDEGEEEPTQN